LRLYHGAGGLFENVDFHRAVLNWLNIRGATFRDVSLRGVFALETDFAGARFERCGFFCANLNRANFTDAVLDDCFLVGALMNGADPRGAKLSNCDLNGIRGGATPDTPVLIKLAGSIYDEKTEWPGDFDPEPFGAINGTKRIWQGPPG